MTLPSATQAGLVVGARVETPDGPGVVRDSDGYNVRVLLASGACPWYEHDQLRKVCGVADIARHTTEDE